MITIDGYTIDAALTEGHALNSEVTDDPVETGSPITDHTRKLPDEITLECIVSDTPLSGVTRAPGTKPTTDAYAVLLGIRDRAEPVTITTSLGTHPNMILKSLSIPRKATDGRSLRFTAGFKQVRIITNVRAFVTVAIPRAASKVPRGAKESVDTKTPGAAPVPEDTRTTMRKIVDRGSAFLSGL